ncbi:hypothetical protein [Kitasatospora sp. NPDC101183]|uniref:hypothetical protein n=1 Tax=Kitasatospora sp. NPDC101183 TaxID=3364100 RepID=UPI00381CB018
MHLGKGTAFGGDNLGKVINNFFSPPKWIWIVLLLALLAGGAISYYAYQQAHHGDVQLTGKEQWAGPRPTKNHETLTLRFDTTESRRFLLLSLSLMGTRAHDPVCQQHATATVALASGTGAARTVSHNQPTPVLLPSGMPGPFTVTLTVDPGCEMNVTVANATLTDESVGTL